MKKLTFLFIFTILVQTIVVSQCPNNISFTTQDQVDNFPIQYPNCTDITGWVHISGNNILNLNGLINLNSIGQELTIDENPNLIDITGLANLNIINGYLHISYNDVLTDLTGLNNLVSVGDIGVTIAHNNSLINLTGLESLTSTTFFSISHNNSLVSLVGLNNLSNISANAYLSISANNNLANLVGLENLTYIEGSIAITDNDSLLNLEGLNQLDSIGGGLHFSRNYNLEEILALSNLQSLGQSLILRENYNLSSLTGLLNLNSIGSDLEIKKCNTLYSLYGLESLISIGGRLDIYENNDLESLNGIENIAEESITDLKITFNPILSLCEVTSICEYIFSPNGDIEVHSNSPGCNNSQEIEYACTVGEQEIKNESAPLIYPTPAKNNIYISTIIGSRFHDITIFNRLGQKVISKTLISNKIDISNLEPGIYIIELASKKQIIREKLMKIE